MRHNASISVYYHEANQQEEFHIFLDSFGSPEEVKRFIRQSIRGKRRELTKDPENFIVHLICAAGRRTEVNIIRARAKLYLWHYRIGLRETAPSIAIRNNLSETKDAFNLFGWLGPERMIISKKEAVSVEIGDKYVKRKKGRPSGLDHLKAQGYLMPPPDTLKK